MAPTVSVVIPVYNGAERLAEAVESVFAQSRPPDEVIVVDDGSTDTTPDVIAALGGSIRHVRQDNAGEAGARNRGVEMASGEFVAFLDHDDLWEPRKLERQIDHIGSFDLSFTDCIEERDGAREPYDVTNWQPELALERFSRAAVILTPSAVMARRDVLRATPFEHVRPFGDDWLMWLRLAEAGCRFGHLAERLTVRRLHDANMSAGHERWLESGEAVFDRLGNARSSASWHLQAALVSRGRGDRRRARRLILAAARAHPPSIRPGWGRLLI